MDDAEIGFPTVGTLHWRDIPRRHGGGHGNVVGIRENSIGGVKSTPSSTRQIDLAPGMCVGFSLQSSRRRAEITAHISGGNTQKAHGLNHKMGKIPACSLAIGHDLTDIPNSMFMTWRVAEKGTNGAVDGEECPERGGLGGCS